MATKKKNNTIMQIGVGLAGGYLLYKLVFNKKMGKKEAANIIKQYSPTAVLSNLLAMDEDFLVARAKAFQNGKSFFTVIYIDNINKKEVPREYVTIDGRSITGVPKARIIERYKTKGITLTA